MKKSTLLLIVLVFFGTPLFGQDLSFVGSDLSSFMEELGKEVIPFLQQNALWGDGLGTAQFGRDSRFYVSVGAGATFADGITRFIDKDNSNFELDVYNLINDAIDSGDMGDLYDQAKTGLPYPAIRLSAGFVPVMDLEVSFVLSIFPQFLAETAASIAGLGVDNLTFNRFNAGFRVRKPLMADYGGFPAVSIGAGHTYSQFNLGYPLPKDKFEQDINGYPLTVEGDLALHTRLHSFGVDVSVSKKLSIFVPFLKLSSWYQLADYSAEAEGFEAILDKPGNNDTKYSDQEKDAPTANVMLHDLAFLLGGGFEINVGKFAILTSGNYSLDSGAFGVALGFRMGFGEGAGK